MNERDEKFLRDTAGRGVPKKQGGWKHWLVALAIIAGMALVAVLAG